MSCDVCIQIRIHHFQPLVIGMKSEVGVQESYLLLLPHNFSSSGFLTGALKGVSVPCFLQSLWDGSELFPRLRWLASAQQGNVCVFIASGLHLGVGEGVWFALRLRAAARGWLLCGQLCSRGPGARGGWGGRAVPCGALEGPVGVRLWLDEGPVGILQQMPVYHSVIDDCIYVGLAVLPYFLQLFWLHGHLGVDVAIVDAYGQGLVYLLFPSEREGAREKSGRQRS